MNFARGAVAVVLFASVMGAAASAAPLPDASEKRKEKLREQLGTIARASGSDVGIFVELLERQESISVNATRLFPLASTFKLPLAMVVLRAVDRKELPPLDGKVRLEASDMLGWASPLFERFPEGGEVTLREVVASLLEHSDNSAADALMRLVGGAGKVQSGVAALGIEGVRIDRNEAELSLDSHGVQRPPAKEQTAARLKVLLHGVSEKEHRAALARFRADPRDHASATAMARVVERAWRGDGLTPGSAEFLRAELARCVTGVGRLRAGVPAGTMVADRTGTCDGLGDGSDCANAVGVIALPSGEHVVVAVYVEDAGGAVAKKEGVIAEVARAVWGSYASRRAGTVEAGGEAAPR